MTGRRRRTLAALAACVGVAILAPQALSAPASFQLEVREVGGAPLGSTAGTSPEFEYLVNEDNTGQSSPLVDPDLHPGQKPMASFSPIVAMGRGTAPAPATITLENTAAGEDKGRYLVTVRAEGYKMWGKHVRLVSDTDPGTVVVELIPHPLPLATLQVSVFPDIKSVNSAPDIPEEGTDPGEGGLGPSMAGFQIILEDRVGHVVVDYYNNPLCTVYDGDPGGEFPPGNIVSSPGCYTNAAGELTIRHLPPGGYSTFAIPPDGSGWIQTSTFEGKHDIDFTNLTEGDDGFGAIGEARFGPLTLPTAFWFGFVKPCNFGNTADSCPTNDVPGSATVTGRARTFVKFPPGATNAVLGQPIVRPWVALSNTGAGGQQVYTARGNANGTFLIPNVPPGEYMLSIWDNPLDYIIRYATFTVAPGDTAINLGDLGVFRWFGWVSGDVFEDSGLDGSGSSIPTAVPGLDPANPAAENGVRDCDPALPTRCEVGMPASDLDIRFRDGSVKSAVFTDPTGHYEFAEEFSKLFRFNILEVGFGRYARTGHSVHNDLKLNNPDGDHDNDGNLNRSDPDLAGVTVVPQDLGGGLLLNQKTDESWRSEVDFGKLEYSADDESTPYDPADVSTWPDNYEGGNGGITGIIFNAITRNELDARLQAAEDYEAGIPDTLLRLWSLGSDGEPNTADDVLMNELNADTWSHPRVDHPDLPQSCDVRDKDGNVLPDPTLAPGSDTLVDPAKRVSERCMELALLGNETKAGAFDGGYAFEEACATGMEAGGDADSDGVPNDDETDPLLPDGPPDPAACASPLAPQDYVVQAVTPDFMQVVREEDVNVNDGDQFVPAFPPAECVGDMHTVDVLGVMPDGVDAVYNPTFAEGTLYDPDGGSPFEGEQKPFCDKKIVTLQDQQNPAADFFFFPNHVPEGMLERDAVEVPTAGRIYGLVTDDTHFESDPTGVLYGEPRPLPNIPIGIRDYTGRLITTAVTDAYGFYEALLPSTYTANCPNPGGYCPGMYIFIIDDPGDPTSPNPTFNPNYLVEPLAFDVWPGKTTLLDTPLDAIAGVTCDPSGTAGTIPPEGGQTLFQPLPEFFTVSQPYGSAGDTVTIKGDFFGSSQGSGEVTLDGVPQTIVPSPAEPSHYPADADGWADNRITFEITGPPGAHQLLVTNDNGDTIYNGVTMHVLGGDYTPPVVTVSPNPEIGATPIQDAIDAAAPGSLVVIDPGTYRENVILHKRVRLQGYGPGGQAGTRFQLSPPDDIRRLVEGTTIDGRFFRYPANTVAWNDTLSGPASPYDEPAASTGVPEGAGITVVAADGEFTSGFNAQIDGLHITLARGTGAGGIQAHAYARFLEISNNILEGNGGEYGGGIGLGSPVVGDNQNDSVEIHNNRIMGSGGRKLAGGIGIFTGAADYAVRGNLLCANYSSEYGAGISHFGRSPNGVIADNTIYFNDAFDEGGGIFLGGEPPASLDPLALSDGTGPVDILRNHINSNVSQDDGGGLMVLDALEARINIKNNIVVNNLAGDFGAIVLDDSSNVAIVNDTIAYNYSTGTAEDRDTTCGQNAPFLSCPHGAGLVSHTHSPAFLNELYGTPTPNCATVDCFSNPVLFNDIFYANEAGTWNPNSVADPGEGDEPPGPALETNGCMDMEVFGVTPTPDPTLEFSPRFSLLSNPYPASGAHPSNIVPPVNEDGTYDCPVVGSVPPQRLEFRQIPPEFPQFVLVGEPVINAGPVGGNPLEIVVEMVKTDPRPMGHNGLPGDYHLATGSPAIDSGTAFLGAEAAPLDDIDRETRPMGASFEMGADESTGAPPGPVDFGETPPEIEEGDAAEDGAVQAGVALAATAGAWTGTPPITFAYQWERSTNSGTSWADIGSATGTTYTTTVGDRGSLIRVEVTASNAGGLYSAVQTSTPVRVLQSSQPAPNVVILSASVSGRKVTVNARSEYCNPCQAVLRIRYGGAWHNITMTRTAVLAAKEGRKWTGKALNVPKGRHELHVRVTDLDRKVTDTSPTRWVTVK